MTRGHAPLHKTEQFKQRKKELTNKKLQKQTLQ